MTTTDGHAQVAALARFLAEHPALPFTSACIYTSGYGEQISVRVTTRDDLAKWAEVQHAQIDSWQAENGGIHCWARFLVDGHEIQVNPHSQSRTAAVTE